MKTYNKDEAKRFLQEFVCATCVEDVTVALVKMRGRRGSGSEWACVGCGNTWVLQWKPHEGFRKWLDRAMSLFGVRLMRDVSLEGYGPWEESDE
jgi:hypothetical protein